MPDKRRRGSTEYSSHPPTLRARARLERLPEEQRRLEQARNREYNAMWQACTRVSRRQDYRRASEAARRNMLLGNLRSIMAKRRESGKLICGLDEAAMVERHLRKEANLRAAQDGSRDVPIALQGVAVDSTQHDTPEAPGPVDNWLESEEQDAVDPVLRHHDHPYKGEGDDGNNGGVVPGLDDDEYGRVDAFGLGLGPGLGPLPLPRDVQDQLDDLEHGLRETAKRQMHQMNITNALLESSQRLEDSLERLARHLLPAHHQLRLPVHRPASSFMPHGMPMMPAPFPHEQEGYPMPNGYAPSPHQQQPQPHQGQQQQHPESW